MRLGEVVRGAMRRLHCSFAWWRSDQKQHGMGEDGRWELMGGRRKVIKSEGRRERGEDTFIFRKPLLTLFLRKILGVEYKLTKAFVP